MRLTALKMVSALVCLAAATIPAQAHKLETPIAPAGKFDGIWAISVVPEHGGCQHYLWHVTIKNGRVTDFENKLANASGGIDMHGDVQMSVVSGIYAVAATGRVNGMAGSGAWALAANVCTGAWTAEKQQ